LLTNTPAVTNLLSPAIISIVAATASTGTDSRDAIPMPIDAKSSSRLVTRGIRDTTTDTAP